MGGILIRACIPSAYLGQVVHNEERPDAQLELRLERADQPEANSWGLVGDSVDTVWPRAVDPGEHPVCRDDAPAGVEGPPRELHVERPAFRKQGAWEGYHNKLLTESIS